MSEYTNRKSKQSSLSSKTNGNYNNSHVANNNSENGHPKKSVATIATDEVRRKSIPLSSKNFTNDAEQIQDNDNGVMTDGCAADAAAAMNGNSNKHGNLNRQSSGETSIDDVNNKLTSHAFQSYDEQEHLESKEIQSPTTEDIPA